MRRGQVRGAEISGVLRALLGLERDGLVSGRLVGRTRMVSINPAYFARQELKSYLARLAEADQEGLLMRQGEAMPCEEIACVLGIEPATARKRFGRALIRLQHVLSNEGLLE